MDVEQFSTVKILFFAQSKELAGTRECTVSLPSKLSYQQLIIRLVEQFNLHTIKKNILLAKNEVVCEESVDIELRDRDNIAVIPPLSGG